MSYGRPAVEGLASCVARFRHNFPERFLGEQLKRAAGRAGTPSDTAASGDSLYSLEAILRQLEPRHGSVERIGNEQSVAQDERWQTTRPDSFVP